LPNVLFSNGVSTGVHGKVQRGKSQDRLTAPAAERIEPANRMKRKNGNSRQSAQRT